MPSIDLGSVVGPQGAQGATGPQGPQGPQGEAGPSQVTGTTSTTLTGLLYGNGSAVGTKQIGTDVAPQAQISGIFSASASYAVGAYVVHNGLLYRCTTAHSGAWDASHFTQVTIGGELNTRTPVYGGGVNLLDNWYFIGGGSQQGGGQFPINQKGQTSYSGTGYGIDRWRSTHSLLTTTVHDSYVSVENPDSDPHTFSQSLYARDFLGKTLTFSIVHQVDGVDFLVTTTVKLPDSIPAAATSYGLKRFPRDVNALGNIQLYLESNGILKAYIVAYSGVTLKLVAAKLELGDTQTLAHQDVGGNWVLNNPPPNFQQELAKCQRYMLAFSNPSTAVKFLGFGRMGNATQARIKILTPVTMVRQPTVIGNIQLYFDNKSEPVSITSFGELWQPDAGGFYLNGNVAAQTSGAFCICILLAGQSVIFDANI